MSNVQCQIIFRWDYFELAILKWGIIGSDISRLDIFGLDIFGLDIFGLDNRIFRHFLLDKNVIWQKFVRQKNLDMRMELLRF